MNKLENITKLFFSFMLKRKVNEEILKICYCANFCGTTKKDSGLENIHNRKHYCTF